MSSPHPRHDRASIQPVDEFFRESEDRSSGPRTTAKRQRQYGFTRGREWRRRNKQEQGRWPDRPGSPPISRAGQTVADLFSLGGPNAGFGGRNAAAALPG